MIEHVFFIKSAMVIIHKNFSCVVSQINEAEILYRVAGAMGGGTGVWRGTMSPSLLGPAGYRGVQGGGCQWVPH